MTNLLKTSVACMLLLVIGVPLESEAQILRNLTKRLEEKIESEATRRAERKIDQAVNKSFDKLEESASSAFKGIQFDQNQIDAMVGAMSADVTLKDTYDFNLGITYETKVTDGNSEDAETTMTMWFSDDSYIGMDVDGGNERMLSVLDEDHVVVFMKDKKTYMAIGSAMFEAMGQMAEEHIQDAVNEPDEEFSFTRLPDETILGQRCKVYQVRSEESESRVWYTEDLGVDMLKSFSKSLSTLTRQDMTQKMPSGMEGAAGVMMKMEARDLNSGEVMTMEAKTIHRNGTMIKSADYKRAGI